MPLESLDCKHHGCPKCGGEDRFRAFDDFDRSGGVICNQCHDKKNSDGFSSIAWLCGCKFTEAIQKVAEFCGLAPAATKKDADADLEWQPWSDLALHFLAAKSGITEFGLQAAGARIARYKRQHTCIAVPIIGQDLDASKPVGWALYNYNGGTLPKYSKTGEVVGQVKVKITYGSKPGLVGVHGIERLKTEGLPELVWKTEGITDMLAMQSLIPEPLRDRHLVVTNSNGAGETPRWQAAVLARCNCYVLHDADKPGQDGAANWTTQIAAQQGPGLHVRNVELPYDLAADHGKDLRDWIAEGHTYADLLALADQSSPVRVQKTDAGEIDYTTVRYPIQEKILKKLQIDVLYEDEEGRIRVFSSLLRKSSWIRQVDRLKKDVAIQICGPPAMIHISNDPDGEETWSIADVRAAIALAASTRRGKDDERGVGIWQGLDDFGNETNTIVIVGNTEACRWNGDKVLRRVLAPRIDGLVLDFGSDAKEWYDFDQLEKDMAAACGQTWRQDVVDSCVALLSQWRWKNPEADPTIVAGLILASWVQTIWAWRPLVAVTGESNAGKSYLFEALGGSDNNLGLFGYLAFKQAKSTEAGIRQGVGKTARVILCDEFEQSKDRETILKVLRTSTRGESIARGSANQKAQKFRLRHISWVAAIEAGLTKQADNNRFIQLDLLRAEKGKHGKLRLPSGGELQRLGQKLLAVAIWSAIEAKRLAVDLKDTQVQGVEARTVESFAVPAAMLGVAYGYSRDEAAGLLRQMAATVDKLEQGHTDHEQLLDDILSARFFIDAKLGQMTVSQILESESRLYDAAHHLAAVGVKEMEGGGIFVAPRVVQRQLLKGMPWEQQSIDKLLLRFEGAERACLRLAGKVARGIQLPPQAIGIEIPIQPKPPESEF